MRGFLGSTWRPPRQTLGARCRAECRDSSVPGGRAWTGSDLQTEQPLLRARIRVRRGHTVGYGGDCREPLGQCRTQRTRGRGDRRGSGGGTRGPAAAAGPGGAAGGPVGLHVVRLHSAWARGSRDQAGHCRDTVTRHGTVALPRTRTPPLCLPSVPRAAVSQAPRPPTRGGPHCGAATAPSAPGPWRPRVCPERGSVSLREAPRIGSVGHRDTCRGHRHSAPLLGTDVLNLRLGDGRHATPPGRTSTTVTMRRCLSDPLTSPPLWWARAPRESHRPPWQRRARLRLAECVWTLHGPRPRPTRSGGLLLLLLSK